MSAVVAPTSPLALAPMPTITSTAQVPTVAAAVVPQVEQVAVPVAVPQVPTEVAALPAVAPVATAEVVAPQAVIPQAEPMQGDLPQRMAISYTGELAAQQAAAAQQAIVAPQVEAVVAPQTSAAPQAPVARPLVDAYVNQLMIPFRQGLSQPGMTVAALNNWLDSGNTLRPEQAAMIKERYYNAYIGMNQQALAAGQASSYTSQDPFVDASPAATQLFIETLISIMRSTFDDGVTTNPWDILGKIQDIASTAQLFGIPQGTTTLPIKVVSGPNTYYHQLTEDQLLGILLYPGELRVQLSLNEVSITRDFLHNLPNSYQEGYVLLNVGDQNYLGHNASLLSGYITGAEWMGKTREEILPLLKISLVKGGQLIPVKIA